MAYHQHSQGHGAVHHNPLEVLTWPVLTGSVAVWPIWPWFQTLWAYAPTPTAIYMFVSAAFMLFQIFDKMGWLHRFKRRPGVPEELPGD